jgi:hypothetical protein
MFCCLKNIPDIAYSLMGMEGCGRRPLCKTLTAADPSSCNFFKFIGKNHALPWILFFIWFLVQQHVNCKANLYRKNIVQDPVCDLCQQDDETPYHLIFGCSFAQAFGVASECISLCLRTMGGTTPRGGVPSSCPLGPLYLLNSCVQATKLWLCRLPCRCTSVTFAWCSSAYWQPLSFNEIQVGSLHIFEGKKLKGDSRGESQYRARHHQMLKMIYNWGT